MRQTVEEDNILNGRLRSPRPCARHRRWLSARNVCGGLTGAPFCVGQREAALAGCLRGAFILAKFQLLRADGTTPPETLHTKPAHALRVTTVVESLPDRRALLSLRVKTSRGWASGWACSHSIEHAHEHRCASTASAHTRKFQAIPGTRALMISSSLRTADATPLPAIRRAVRLRKECSA